MSRTRTAFIHFWPSMAVVAIIAGLVAFAWYPGPFLQSSANTKISLLLIGIAGLVGPGLTWLFYKDHKLKFRFDVTVIVLIQLAAIGWTTAKLFQNRPYYMVFALDRFEVLTRADIDPALVSEPQFLGKPFAGPIMTYAAMPTDPKAYSDLVREVMLEGKPDIHLRPDSWRLYADRQTAAAQAARPLEQLRTARPGSARDIDRWVERHGGGIDRFRFVPAWGRFGEFAAVLDADSGSYLGGINASPWLY